MDQTEQTQAKPRRRHRWMIVAVVPIYFASYLLLGEHRSGETFEQDRPVTARFTYHDRDYSFDPWLFLPAAYLECLARGGDTQIALMRGRSGRHYGCGPFRYMTVDPELRRILND